MTGRKKPSLLMGLKKASESLRKKYYWLFFIAFLFFFSWSSPLLSVLNSGLDHYTLSFVSMTSDLTSLLSVISAILGTILAISFSISIVVIQNGASSYTPSVLELYKKDSLTLLFFFYYVGSLTLTIITLQDLANTYLVNMTVVAFLFSFLFLLAQFFHIIDLIDPRGVIEKAKLHCFKDIKRLRSAVSSIIKKEDTTDPLHKELAKTPMYYWYVFHHEKGIHLSINQQILLISDVITKSSLRKEIETSTKGLGALAEIAENYIDIKTEDFTAEDELIVNLYNQLLSIFNIASNNKDIALMQENIRTIERIGDSTTKIKPLFGSNQTTKLAIYHICSLSKETMNQSFFDVTAQGIRSMQNLGINTIKKTGDDGLSSNYIFEIGRMAVESNSWYILGLSINALKELLCEAIAQKIDVNSEPIVIMKHISTLSVLSINSHLDQSLSMSLIPASPEFSIKKAALIALKVKDEQSAKVSPAYLEQYSQGILHGLLRMLATIAISSANQHSTYTLWGITGCLREIALIMLKEKLVTIKEGYTTEVLTIIEIMKNSYLSVAGYSFDEEVHLPAPTEIVDSITSIGSCALDSHKEITNECITALYIVSNAMIKRDQYGYEVARHAARIGVIGVIALSKNETAIANKAAELLSKFDKAYSTDSPNPRVGLHIQEIELLHDLYNSETMARSESEGYSEVFKHIDEGRIRDFIKLYENQKK